MQRVELLLDRGSFVPLAAGSRGPLVAGSGRVGGARVIVAFTDGHARGGTIGVHEASILARITELAAAGGEAPGEHPVAVILGFDTGGVRVEEGPRALAAAAAAGVGLARLTLMGVRSAAVISGPRGCFGAPAVMAALPEHIIMTPNARWGLTGPKLLQGLCDAPGAEQEALQATSAESRLANGDAHAVVADDAAAVRSSVLKFLSTASNTAVASLEDRIAASAAVTERLRGRFVAAASASTPSRPGSTARRRRRDLLRYSFRGQWKASGPIERRGLIQTALGTLADHPALGIVVGPEPSRGAGVGIEEAAVITKMIRAATGTAGAVRAAILTFMFCQGHALDLAQERFGLHRALAECLRAMVAARLRGHPIVSILGGGTYGAAYLALAAPSHRILAMRGTSIAPMAPAVLRAFQALRGRLPSTHAPAELADLIPEIHIVDSVIRLPRVVRDELSQLRAIVRPEGMRA